MNIEYTLVRELKPYPNNARTHSKKQIRKIANSMKRFGFNNPVLIDDNNQIIAGHGRVEAAKLLALHAVPTVRLSHLSETEKRAYILADNKLAAQAGRTARRACDASDRQTGLAGCRRDQGLLPPWWFGPRSLLRQRHDLDRR